jgi:hypothetical protein
MKHRFATCAAACALALAGVANQAYAVDSACKAPAGGFTFDVFLSGASAPQQIITGVMNDVMTVSGIVTETGSATGASGNFRVFCGNTIAPLPAGSVRIQYRARGGSAFGVFPVAQKGKIAWMDVDDPACSGANGACPIKGDDTGNNGLPPDYGVSDVQPDMFRAPFNIGPPFLTPPWTTSVLGLTVFRTNLVAFGIPITNNVTLANVTEVQMRDVFRGAVTTWAALGATGPGAAGPIHICRRARGSGTQAVYNHFFNGQPLVSDGTVPPRTAPATPTCGNGGTQCNASAGRIIVENTSTSDVRTCLNAAQTGSTYTFVDDRGVTNTVDFTGGPHGAIGTLSMENRGGTTGEPGNWTYRLLEGVDSTNPGNLTTGLQDLMYEQTCQRRTSVLGTNYNGTKSYGSQIPLINAFCGSLQKGTILQSAAANVVNSVRALPGIQNNTPPPGGITSFCRRLTDTAYKMTQVVPDPGGNQCP